MNVYAEAKSEYTRQLCQSLGPALQLYFLDLLKVAKEKDTDARRMLWNFQALLQEIPDWNQDKVLRETERIQRDSNCDYLEELLTAVFIAHTKVLSAIRITTKQKKLQITIPKIDHFLHRTLRETGRLLWGNAYLFAEQGSPIDRQKNMRQIEALIQEGIQQSIRSLLPVKTILREYLNEEADDGEDDAQESNEKAEKQEEDEVEISTKNTEEVEKEKPAAPPAVPIVSPPEENQESASVPEVQHATLQIPAKSNFSQSSVVNIIKEQVVSPKSSEEGPVNEVQMPSVGPGPTLVVETEPSVSFTNMDTIFDSDNPEGNEIAHASHSEEEEEDEIDHINMVDAPPEPLDGFEDLEAKSDGGIEFEEIA